MMPSDMAQTKFAVCRDGAVHCEKTISEGVFEQWLHAEVHGARQIHTETLLTVYEDGSKRNV